MPGACARAACTCRAPRRRHGCLVGCLAALPAEIVLTDEEIAEIDAVGDNAGCMALKGAAPDYEGDAVADQWPLDEQLAKLAARWDIDPDSQLRLLHV